MSLPRALARFARRPVRVAVVSISLASSACEGPPIGEDAEFASEIRPQTNWDRDLVATQLSVDLQTHEATATVDVAAGTRRGVSLDVRGLDIHGVRGAAGPLAYKVEDGRL